MNLLSGFLSRCVQAAANTSLCSHTHIYGCDIAPVPVNCSELWFPAGDIHAPDKQNKVSSALEMKNEHDKAWRQKPETGLL